MQTNKTDIESSQSLISYTHTSLICAGVERQAVIVSLSLTDMCYKPSEGGGGIPSVVILQAPV